MERRELLSGVTLITHGFNSSVDGWVTAMAQAIADRPDLTIDQPIYRWDVTDPGHDGGPLSVASTKVSGPAITDLGTEDPEIAVLLDWSDVAGDIISNYTRSTGDVAAAVATRLLSAAFLVELGQPLANLPLHLIGHSRGGSLVGALANELGQHGIWVEQVTTLDPHPVDGINDPFGLDFGDAPMVAWDNVVYWDNYWRENNDLFDFKGEPVANTHDVHLSDAVLAVGGYSYEHSDVHLWYYGTIDTSEDPPANNGDEDVPNDWYGGENPDRLTSGYAYSRVVGVERASDGVTAQCDGGLAERQPVAVTSSAWPNVVGLQVAGTGTTFVDGAAIPLEFYQADADSTAAISFSLDSDLNPLNGNEQFILLHSVVPAATLQFDSAELPTGNVVTGTYYVLAAIADNAGHTRYAYAPQAVIVDNPNANLPPTDILLDATTALENVTGYRIGQVTVVDPNVGDTHTVLVSDHRFEVVDGYLRLKPDQSLNAMTDSPLDIMMIAIDAGGLAMDSPKYFTITVTANPYPWHNMVEGLDVTGDGFVSPVDGLRVINELISRKYTDSLGKLPATRPDAVENYYDVNADGYVTPIDALRIINHLNRVGEGEAEGESSTDRSLGEAIASQCDFWQLLGGQRPDVRKLRSRWWK